MVRLAKIQDFASTKRRSFRILGRWIGIFREDDGSFRAMDIACKHQNVNLLHGILHGDEVTCPAHGWRYNLRTGECLWGGSGELRPYLCEVRGEDIYVSMHPAPPTLDQDEEEDQFDFDYQVRKKGE